ncbi:MAG: redoxin domain-containing protein [Acidobacteria bacterium]|nr:redoxin domain-containing protein [Acidobacteriota bacterium]
MQLQRAVPRFRSRGLGLAALTYDDASILAQFAARDGIDYPLLSDPNSEFLRKIRMVDPDNTPANRPDYGKRRMAFPGYFLIDRGGVVRERSLDAGYNDRRTAGAFLAGLFPELVEQGGAIAAPHLGIETFQSDPAVSPGSRFTLGVRLTLPPRMHVYAPGVEHYRPIALSLTSDAAFSSAAPVYPAPKILRLEAIRETVPVFEGEFTIDVDVRLVSENIALLKSLGHDRSKLTPLVVKGELSYQACDDVRCFLPEVTPVTWELKVRQLDFRPMLQH